MAMKQGNYFDVVDFHKKFSFKTPSIPTLLSEEDVRQRIDFMQEELNEFIDGAVKGDICEQADALIDLVYVAMGTAARMGLCWEALWEDVHRANMAKVKGPSERSLTDVVKPTGWEGPRTREIIDEHTHFITKVGEILQTVVEEVDRGQ